MIELKFEHKNSFLQNFTELATKLKISETQNVKKKLKLNQTPSEKRTKLKYQQNSNRGKKTHSQIARKQKNK